MQIGRTFPALALLLFVSVLLDAQQTEASGSVTVSYKFSRLYPVASNQYAIWIETDGGSFVRTLLVTDFTGKRAGWKIRPQSLPNWVRAAGVANVPQKEVDAVSAPTQGNGVHCVIWDLKDSKGKLVAPGRFRYLIEGSILWDREVLWSGTVEVGGEPQISHATARYIPAAAQDCGTLISDVTASYAP